MSKTSRNEKHARKTKNDWLIAALNLLETSGHEGVIIEHLAANMHTAKSSFYWHFRNRNELLNDLLTYWSEEYTEDLIQELNNSHLDAADKLYQVMLKIHQLELAKYDLVIRAWAKHDLLARRAVNRVNKLRRNFIRSIFEELGFRGDELDMRTRLFVCDHSFETPMFGKLSQKEWEKLAKRRLKLLASK